MDSICQTRKEESSASNSAWIPHDVITEILLRLPVKTLLRFRCVCKSWKSLISDVDFIRKHLVRMSSMEYPLHRHLLFRIESIPHFEAISLDSVLRLRDYDSTANRPRSILQLDETLSGLCCPVASCNGLILLLDVAPGILYLWNPSIRETNILPDGNLRTLYRVNNIFGFGYDSLSNDYKVVEVSGRRASLYSLRANSWRRIVDSPCIFRDSFCCGNALIFKVDFDRPNQEIFVSFDLVKESFQEHPLPVNRRYGHNLCESRGDVCAMYDFGSHIDVWVMKEFGVKESWVKILTFPSPSADFGRTICMLDDGVLMLGFSSFVVYNKKNNTCKTIMVEGSHMYFAQIYVESLVSPNGEL